MLTCISGELISRPLAFKSLEEIFAGYARVAPLAHALYRTAEANHLRQAPLLRPVLDLGCGSGEFAQLALRSNVDVGIDLSLRRLSRRNPDYRDACVSDACRLPFADDEFQTVLAVSVLEHLHHPEQVLAEVCRVLRPGGRLIGTATLLDMHEQLFYPPLLRCLRLSPLGRLYVRLHDWLFAHRCLLRQSQWEAMLTSTGTGLELLVSRKIVPPRLTRYWDLLLAFAWPVRLLPRWAYSLTFHPPGVRAWVQKHLLPLCGAKENVGSSWFFVARKPEESP